MSKVTIGGERLGAGKQQKVHLRNYERSTHDLGYTWRSTMAAGTLVPFLTEVGLPGDTFNINLNVDVMTHPTIGPLFGSYKVQLDVFSVPIRLYNAKLHMNMLGIGLKMSEIKLPQLELDVHPIDIDETKTQIEEGRFENSQINASSLLSHLNIRGLGINRTEEVITREINAIPTLAYWDIYKNYYANKQEEIGMIIHTPVGTPTRDIYQALLIINGVTSEVLERDSEHSGGHTITVSGIHPELELQIDDLDEWSEEEKTHYLENMVIAISDNDIPAGVKKYNTNNGVGVRAIDFWQLTNIMTSTMYFQNPYWETNLGAPWSGVIYSWTTLDQVSPQEEKVNITEFPLKNIDDMRIQILQHNGDGAFKINKDITTLTPYRLMLNTQETDEKWYYSRQHTQEGLGLKTYQSDLFNNWISTEWIDGDNGVNAVTAISTEEEFITIDQINLSRKIYDMLNRIAISGGSYDDWLDATYTHERSKSVENPIYMGGLSSELIFEEVVSNAASESDNVAQPLGTLAGKGRLNKKRKGGKVKIKVDEPSYIMGIVSLTPRIDYSQGNKWDVNLKTMDDFHKPALDEIGFQDLITEQMGWFETELKADGTLEQKSAGKQPAWINYMTNVNVVRGNFAEENQQMFMTLNRKYDAVADDEGVRIKDLTTYIDPSKFNHIFADTRIDAQNFWAQIAVGMTVRRKMSAKVMPNL